MRQLRPIFVVIVLTMMPTILLAQDPANFSTSLHAMRTGKTYWYKAENGGFENLTGIPMSNLNCTKCHPGTFADGSAVDPATYSPGCNDCHNFAQGNAVPDEQCLKCHGRQNTEINQMGFSDVHRDMGFSCTSCHGKQDMHGDGVADNTMFDEGAIEKTCETCHVSLVDNQSHSIHSDKLECTTCHLQSVITCYNCHFESEVEGHVKRAHKGLKGFMLLAKRQSTGKITSATFMSMTYQGKSFYTLAPYTAHNVTTEAKQCSDCHGNANVRSYVDTGQITMSSWDAASGMLSSIQGVVPVPPDWQQAFKFDFLGYTGDVAGETDPTKWEYLKSEADLNQMLYLDPLSQDEVAMLANEVPSDFATSLHGTRQGKATWYSEANGGFEAFTHVPMDSLPCQQCHATTYANGDTVRAATYAPGCQDCHDFSQGTEVAQQTCLGCHSRQGAEIKMSGSNAMFSDVHRDQGMVCTDCHTYREMHGDGTAFASMREPGAMDVSCDNEECHPVASLASNQAHSLHMDDVYCTACHVQTVETCYNCHFPTEVEGHAKRFYKQAPTGGFAMLVRRANDGKVTTASYQALVDGENSFYAIGAFNGHTIAKNARECDDCHNNANVQQYKQSGVIVVTKWDESQNIITFTPGVIPVPPDWQQALKLDFVNYTGDVHDPLKPFDPATWVFQETGADGSQMLYADPLTSEQIDKLAMDVTAVDGHMTMSPASFKLEQNYPNPFNPQTTLEFSLPHSSQVVLKIYTIQGEEVATVLNQKLQAGTHRVSMTATELSSGVYVYRLTTPDFTASKKMIVMK